jgi:hypothetical protein
MWVKVDDRQGARNITYLLPLLLRVLRFVEDGICAQETEGAHSSVSFKSNVGCVWRGFVSFVVVVLDRLGCWGWCCVFVPKAPRPDTYCGCRLQKCLLVVVAIVAAIETVQREIVG